MAVDGPLYPLARLLADVERLGQLQPGVNCSGDERFAEDVGGQAVERRGEPQQLIGAKLRVGDDLADLGRSDGQGAGLVKQHRIAAHPPGQTSHEDRGGEEETGVAVGIRTNGARSVWACSTSRTSAAYALSPTGPSARRSNGAPAFADL